MTRMRWLAIGSLAPALAGCALAPPDELDRELSRFYGAHASEEDGACQSPQIASLTERTELEGGLVEVRYTYFEPDEDQADWTQVFHKPVRCTGAGERQFTVERTKIGIEVVDMTGPRRVAEPDGVQPQ